MPAAVNAAGSSYLCEALFLPPSQNHAAAEISVDEIAAFIASVEGRKKRSFRESAERLVEKSPIFADQSKTSKGFWDLFFPTQSLKKKIAQHHRAFFSRFNSELKARIMRDKSIAENLRHRGYPHEIEEGQGRATLEYISRINSQRIARSHNVSAEYRQDKEISRLVDQLSFVSSRNSITDKIYSGNIISSRQINLYGLEGGLNSKNDFNREFLKSDDDVFFYLRPSFGKKKNTEISEYGSYTRILRDDFAEKHSWVSPFIMYPKQFYNSLRLAFPNQFKAEEGEVFKAGESDHQMLSHLYLLDMTLIDYKRLVTDQLGTSLYELKTDSASENKYGMTFQEARTLLSSKDPDVFEKVFHQLVYRRLSLLQPELKIPVSVPQTALLKESQLP